LPSFCESLRFFVATSMPAGLIEVWLAKRRRRVELNRFLTWLSVLSMIGRWGWIKVSRFYSGFGASVRMETSLEKRAEVVTPNRLFAQVAVSIFPFRWKVTESESPSRANAKGQWENGRKSKSRCVRPGPHFLGL